MNDFATSFDEVAMMCRRKAAMRQVSIRLHGILHEPIIQPQWRDYTTVYDQLWRTLSECRRIVLSEPDIAKAATRLRSHAVQAQLALRTYQQPTSALRYEVSQRVYSAAAKTLDGADAAHRRQS